MSGEIVAAWQAAGPASILVKKQLAFQPQPNSDAMPMFFLCIKQRCDVDGFWTFLPSKSVRFFLFNHWYRLFQGETMPLEAK